MSSSNSSLVALETSLGKSTIRKWMSQGNTEFEAHNFVLPIFVVNKDSGDPIEIDSMPAVYRHTISSAIDFIDPLINLELRSILLFPVMDVKGIQYMDSVDHNPVLRLIPILKRRFPALYIIVDVCLCTFTLDGHCYMSDNDSGEKISKLTLDTLGKLSVAYARAGCDMVAPSDMNDGRVSIIRKTLNGHDYNRVALMSYSAKFASNFYGPFRDAANSSPKHGDRQTYQLPPGSLGLALRAIGRDIDEGADVIMIKPGLPYLDVIAEAKRRFPDIPRAVYHVSGEYSMLRASADKGYLQIIPALWEILTCFKRSGANIIITYYTPIILETLKNSN
ncbi:porphobilinogen synthase [Brevipalpus obovatus]|uniref:porphobilinogen synthase n=1 Tax=Brevipalpus obovatus TaxID=246614 RepID=UPI003D9DC37D